jgi:hypothetical protein
MNIKTKELIVPKDVILSKASVEILIKVRSFGPLARFTVLTRVINGFCSCWNDMPYGGPRCHSSWPCVRT